MGCDEAWAAGFVDGEGYLALTPVHARKSDGVHLRRPKIEVAQTVKKPLLKLQKMFGGVIYEMPPRRGVQRKKWWRYDLTGVARVRSALQRMLPYMQVKGPQARLLLRFIDLMCQDRSAISKGISKKAEKKREAMYNELQKLRKVG